MIEALAIVDTFPHKSSTTLMDKDPFETKTKGELG